MQNLQNKNAAAYSPKSTILDGQDLTLNVVQSSALSLILRQFEPDQVQTHQ